MGINAYDQVQYNSLNLPGLEELAKIPMMLNAKHEAAEEEIALVGAESEQIALLASDPLNKEVAKRYQNFQNQLKSVGDTLLKQGVGKSNIRAKIGNLKGQYLKEIAPVLQAQDLRHKDLAMLKELQLRDPSMIVDYDATQYSIDSYLQRGNSSADIRAISGTAIKESAGQKFSILASELQKNGIKNIPTSLPFQYVQLIESGVPVDQVMKALQGQYSEGELGNFGKQIQTIIDSTLQEFGVGEKFEAGSQAYNQAVQAALSGVVAAVGAPKLNNVTDNYSMQVSLDAMRDKAARNKAAKEAPLFPLFPLASESKFSIPRKLSKIGSLVEGQMESGVTTLTENEIFHLNKAGISTVYDDGTPKTPEQLHNDIELYNKTNATMIMGLNIPVDNTTNKAFASAIKATLPSSTVTELIDAASGDLKGQVTLIPRTRQLGIQVNGKFIEIPFDKLDPSIQTAMDDYTKQLATNVGLHYDPNSIPTVEALQKQVYNRTQEIRNTKVLPGIQDEYDQSKKLIEEKFGPNISDKKSDEIRKLDAIKKAALRLANDVTMKVAEETLSKGADHTLIVQTILQRWGQTYAVPSFKQE